MENSKITAGFNLAKKHPKNYLVVGLLAAAGLLLFGYMQLGWFGATTKSDTQWLMVLHAGEAEITERSGETFLTLSEVSGNTVFFSDRPERKYQSVDTNDFLEQWDALFASSPPNAAMVHAEVGVDTELVIIELFTPAINGTEISFPIEIVGGEYTKGETYTDVNLFIDDLYDYMFRDFELTANTPPATTSTEDTSEEVTVTVSGGHEIRAVYEGYPIDLIAGLLGITSAQALDSFYYLVPEVGGSLNYEEDAEAYRVALLAQLGYLGITVDELDTATSYYQSTNGDVWSYDHADLKAIIEDDEVTGFEIIDGGRGYTSQPTITVEGYGSIGVEMTISYTDNFNTNGAISDIRLRDSAIIENQTEEVSDEDEEAKKEKEEAEKDE